MGLSIGKSLSRNSNYHSSTHTHNKQCYTGSSAIETNPTVSMRKFICCSENLHTQFAISFRILMFHLFVNCLQLFSSFQVYYSFISLYISIWIIRTGRHVSSHIFLCCCSFFFAICFASVYYSRQLKWNHRWNVIIVLNGFLFFRYSKQRQHPQIIIQRPFLPTIATFMQNVHSKASLIFFVYQKVLLAIYRSMLPIYSLLLIFVIKSIIATGNCILVKLFDDGIKKNH